MQRKLDMQADRIEAVLASHKVGGRVAGGTVTARFVRFDLVTPMGTRINLSLIHISEPTRPY